VSVVKYAAFKANPKYFWYWICGYSLKESVSIIFETTLTCRITGGFNMLRNPLIKVTVLRERVFKASFTVSACS